MASMALYDLMLEGLPLEEHTPLLREAIIRHNQGHGSVAETLAGLVIRRLRTDVGELQERCDWLEQELADKRGRRWRRA
jgi:hypothetical protein